MTLSLLSIGRSAIALVLLVVVLAGPASALFCGSDNCYEVLGVKREATKSEIRRAYRRLSVEKHPDKRPGDAKVAEEFRLIGDAYTALKDDAKRAKYNDFLDNPGKYWDFLMANSKQVTPPKTNFIIAIMLVLGAASIINWLNMNHNYTSTLDRMRASPEFKREVSRLIKTKAAKNVEEAESMINLEVVGLEEPHWKNLAVVKLVMMPQRAFEWVKWQANWQLNYRVMKKEYTMDDKRYLILKNIKMSELEYERLSESAQQNLFDQELWDAENAAEYSRLERIALNKAGKARKMKKKAAAAEAAATPDEDLVE